MRVGEDVVTRFPGTDYTAGLRYDVVIDRRENDRRDSSQEKMPKRTSWIHTDRERKKECPAKRAGS